MAFDQIAMGGVREKGWSQREGAETEKRGEDTGGVEAERRGKGREKGRS